MVKYINKKRGKNADPWNIPDKIISSIVDDLNFYIKSEEILSLLLRENKITTLEYDRERHRIVFMNRTIWSIYNDTRGYCDYVLEVVRDIETYLIEQFTETMKEIL